MDELIEIYHRLPEIHPEVRSAWIHHAFTQIHPFQDGNGRVARALASIDFIKAGLFPLIVHRTQREEYLQALVQADQGDLSLLVKMFYRLQEESFRRAISQSEQIL
jgi:Fic family protein